MSIRVRRLLIFWSGGGLGGNLGIIFLSLLLLPRPSYLISNIVLYTFEVEISTQEKRFGESDLVRVSFAEVLVSVPQTQTSLFPLFPTLPQLSNALDFSLLYLLGAFTPFPEGRPCHLQLLPSFSPPCFPPSSQTGLSQPRLHLSWGSSGGAGPPAPPLGWAWSPESAPSLPTPNHT